jgi:hypothetical protein
MHPMQHNNKNVVQDYDTMHKTSHESKKFQILKDIQFFSVARFASVSVAFMNFQYLKAWREKRNHAMIAWASFLGGTEE